MDTTTDLNTTPSTPASPALIPAPVINTSPTPVPAPTVNTGAALPGATIPVGAAVTAPNAALPPTNSATHVDDGSSTDRTSGDDNGASTPGLVAATPAVITPIPATTPSSATVVAPATTGVVTGTGTGTGTVIDSNTGTTEDKGSGEDVVTSQLNSSDVEIKHNTDGSVSIISNVTTNAVGTSGLLASVTTGATTPTTPAAPKVLTFAHPDRVDFKDSNIAFDLSPTGHAGEAVEALGTVATGAIANKAIVGVVIKALDAGASLHDVFQSAINSGVISNLSGGSSNEALATLVYHNVTGQTPDANTVHSLAGLMQGSGGTMSQADFLTAAATSSINQGHVDLVGLQQTGVHFI